MYTYRLSSGFDIPALGLGTWQCTGIECRKAVVAALDSGYTHIDTAFAYGNHHDIGRSIKEYGADRSTLFITTKIFRDRLRRDDAIRQAELSLKELMTDYIDLLLIHWPNPRIPLEETFEAFRILHDAGKVRSIGVSNFTASYLEQARRISNLPISINQVEFHPLLNQRALLEYCTEHNILVTAYSPLARGEVFDNRILGRIAERKGKSPALISLRWLFQKGMAVIPKAGRPEHIRENLGMYGFSLSDEEMTEIDSLKEHRRLIKGEWAGVDLDE